MIIELKAALLSNIAETSEYFRIEKFSLKMYDNNGDIEKNMLNLKLRKYNYRNLKPCYF